MKKHNYIALLLPFFYTIHLCGGFDPKTNKYFPDFIKFLFFEDPKSPQEVTLQYGHRKVVIKQGEMKMIRVNKTKEDKGKIYITHNQFNFTISYPRNKRGIISKELYTDGIVVNVLPEYSRGELPLPEEFSVVAYID